MFQRQRKGWKRIHPEPRQRHCLCQLQEGFLHSHAGSDVISSTTLCCLCTSVGCRYISLCYTNYIFNTVNLNKHFDDVIIEPLVKKQKACSAGIIKGIIIKQHYGKGSNISNDVLTKSHCTETVGQVNLLAFPTEWQLITETHLVNNPRFLLSGHIISLPYQNIRFFVPTLCFEPCSQSAVVGGVRYMGT